LARRDLTLEQRMLERMILDAHGSGPLGDLPAAE
jgi:hypothetical protein